MEPYNYEVALNNFMSTDRFIKSDESTKQELLKNARQSYLDDNPDAEVARVDAITEDRNVNYLRATGQGRIIPKKFLTDNHITMPFNQNGWDELTRKQKRSKLDRFKETIPEISSQNPTQRGDTEYYLIQQVENQQKKLDLPIQLSVGTVTLLLLLAIIYFWAIFSIKKILTSGNKERMFNFYSCCFFLIFAIGSTGLLLLSRLNLVLFIPWLIAFAGIGLTFKFVSYCAGCRKFLLASSRCDDCK